MILQTIGSVDMPGSGPRKLPAPRQYVIVVVAWSVLELVAASGRARLASAFGWIMVLSGLVIGPFGQRAVSLLNTTAQQFGVTNQGGGNAPVQGPNPFPKRTA